MMDNEMVTSTGCFDRKTASGVEVDLAFVEHML